MAGPPPLPRYPTRNLPASRLLASHSVEQVCFLLRQDKTSIAQDVLDGLPKKSFCSSSEQLWLFTGVLIFDGNGLQLLSCMLALAASGVRV